MTSINASETVFDFSKQVAPLSIIAMDSMEELAKKIDKYLTIWSGNSPAYQSDSFLIDSACPRFSSGDAKGIIKQSIRGNDIYILVDVGNYNCTYKMFGNEVPKSPDDHFQDLKRIIQAASGKGHRITVIMPLLYGGRQHRRNYRESLDCAVALQELERMGVTNIVTFDAHDTRVQNAIPLMGFDNVMPSYQVLKTLLSHFDDIILDSEHLMIVSPDEGALNRNIYYASVLGVNMGMFYKRRDYSTVINGRNPIIAHEYLGESVEGKDIFIADDMIASGESMLDIAYELKKRKAKRIFTTATFAIFTAGLDCFEKAYNDGVINGVLGTNLTYFPPECRQKPWFMEVDVSKYIAYIIAAANHDFSVSIVLDPLERIQTLTKKYKEMQKEKGII